MSFAVIQTGGKQYKVSASEILKIERLENSEGKTVEFKNVLFLNDNNLSKSFLYEYNNTIMQLKEYKSLINRYENNNHIKYDLMNIELLIKNMEL